jgi:hypothetical protein
MAQRGNGADRAGLESSRAGLLRRLAPRNDEIKRAARAVSSNMSLDAFAIAPQQSIMGESARNF